MQRSPLTIVARIRIELPDRFSFSTTITVYISHINYGNHLDNSALLSLVSEARVRFFKALGYSELDVEGLGIIVADAAIKIQQRHTSDKVIRLWLGDKSTAQGRVIVRTRLRVALSY